MDSKPLSLPHNIKQEYLETCREISILLEMIQGFEIIFIECNPPVLQRDLEGYLEAHNKRFTWIKVSFEQKIEDLVHELSDKNLNNDKNTILSIRGLEKSIPYEPKAARIVARLNFARDLLPKYFPCPFILWLPQYALENFSHYAPDLWSWRGGIFYFKTHPEPPGHEPILQTKTEISEKYSKAYKEAEIGYLTPIVKAFNAKKGPQREIKKHIKNLIRLADYLHDLSNYKSALSYLEQAERLCIRIKDNVWLALCYNNIGLIYSNKGEWDKALEYYLKSEKIRIEVGDRAGLVSTYFNMGTVYLNKNDTAEGNNYIILAGFIARMLGMKHELSQMAWALEPILKEIGEEGFMETGRRLARDRGIIA